MGSILSTRDLEDHIHRFGNLLVTTQSEEFGVDVYEPRSLGWESI